MITKGLQYNGIDYSKEYTITNTGVIKNLKTGRIIKQTLNHHCDWTFTLYGKTAMLKKAVAFTFLDNPLSHKRIYHLDKNTMDCSASNLIWSDKQPVNSISKNKLTPYQVRLIRRNEQLGASLLAMKYNVSPTTIHNILECKTWKEVTI